MNKVCSYQEISNYIKIIKEGKKGIITNFYPDFEKVTVWINSDEFYFTQKNNTLFLFRINKGFINLFFLATSLSDLNDSLILLIDEEQNYFFVVELVGKKHDIDILSTIYYNNSFFEYTTFLKMNRWGYKENNFVNNENVKPARTEQTDNIENLLNTYFDIIAEHLPGRKEIEEWIENGNISVYESDEKIYGFVIYDIKGRTSHLRYWFVLPEYRNEKIGSSLFSKFLNCSKNVIRLFLWVMKNNENAINRYKHYGFEEEDFYNMVLTNRKK